MSISTHVLDAGTGRPAEGVTVRLEDHTGAVIREAATDADGRVKDLAGATAAGIYRLTFEVGDYFEGPSFYPEVTVTFRITDEAAHHHVPLLLSPFAYSTYRGS